MQNDQMYDDQMNVDRMHEFKEEWKVAMSCKLEAQARD